MITLGFIIELFVLITMTMLFILFFNMDTRKFFIIFFIIGLLYKLSFFFFINYQINNYSDGFAFKDDYSYHYVSKEMAEHWEQGEFYSPKEIKYQAEKNPGYYYLNAFIYSIFGSNFYNSRLVNLFFSIIIGFYIYLIGNKIFSRKSGVIAAYTFLLLPDINFWSSMQFKDLSVTLLVIMIFYNLFYSLSHKRGFFLSLFLIILLSFTRIESAMLILITYFITKLNLRDLLSNYKRIFPIIIVFFCLFIFIFIRQGIFETNLIIGLNKDVLNFSDFRSLLNHYPYYSTEGLLSYGYIFSIYDIWKLPITIFILLFTPFPPSINTGQIGSTLLSILSIPWLLLVPLIFFSFYKIITDKLARQEVKPMLIFIIAYILMLSLFLFTFSPIRHRIEIIPFLIIFASPILTSMNKTISWLLIGILNFSLISILYMVFKT